MDAEPPRVTAPERKRRWFQFSLRTLMIFVVAVAVPCAWLGHWQSQKRREQAAVDALVRTGADVEFDYQLAAGSPNGRVNTRSGLAWLRGLFGENAFDEVVQISCHGCDDCGLPGKCLHLTDDDLVSVRDLPSLKAVRLMGTYGISDAGIKNLAGLTRLEELWITGTEVTDTGLKSLSQLKHLTHLTIEGTRITDAGVQSLGDLRQLTHLTLKGNRITDAGMAKFAASTQLRYLWLEEAAVTDAGLVHLESLNQLEELGLILGHFTDASLCHIKGLTGVKSLNLFGSRITDAGLASLEKMCRLEDLDLSGTEISDGAIGCLQRFPHLRSLAILRVKMTDSGIDRLKRLLPGCNVIPASLPANEPLVEK